MRYVGSLAGHGVVGFFDGELEGVVAAEAVASVGDVTRDAGDDSWLARLEVCDGVQVTLAGTSNSSPSEINLKFFGFFFDNLSGLNGDLQNLVAKKN